VTGHDVQRVATLDNHSRQVLEAVYDIGETFTRSLHLQPVLERIIASLIALAQADAGSVMLVSESGDELVVVAAIGPRAEVILGTRQPVTESLAGRAVREGTPIVIDGRVDRTTKPSGGLVSSHPQDLSRSLLMPLRVAGRLVGVLNLSCETDPSPLGPPVVGLLQLLANQAAIIIENARLYEELARKERRLELFVDRVLRTQAEEKQAARTSEAELEAVLSNVMRRTLQEFSRATQASPSEYAAGQSSLTERERDVLRLVVEGLTNKEIATRLQISAATVKNHVLHITNKLGATDRTQAAVSAIRLGLLT
jgi:DNA-binding CsgD family transcriptional regulator/transcriptional regulator with GAF, ATPase, and Fis domain